ncbi:MAG: right-handed parallel beta-helix repeat-containing protein [Candidatus Wallbacteria bacterium]|nr:right-handed parallel beta-helix repeat-containing protein [Candidatus Wallbacteria bacterium]
MRSYSTLPTTRVVLAAGCLWLAATLAGCSGGGGGGTGTAATVTSKAIRIQMATPDVSSFAASLVSTPPRVEDVKSIVLTVYEDTSNESKVIRTVTAPVPPYSGEIVVRDIPPGRHLITVSANKDDGRPAFSGDFVSKFAPGEPTFVDFTAAPVADVSRFSYAGGQLPAIPFTYVITAAGSPYRITDIIFVPKGVRLEIQPGVELRFENDTAQQTGNTPYPADMQVEGRLTCVGTRDLPITLTRNVANTVSKRPRILFTGDQPDPIQSRVRNTIIQACLRGIELYDSDISISSDQFIDRVELGVVVGPLSSSNLRGNLFRPQALSIAGRPSSAIFPTGIQVTGAVGTPILRNQILGGLAGIRASESRGLLIEGNDITDTQAIGIELSDVKDVLVNSNRVSAAQGSVTTGIQVTETTGILAQNRVTGGFVKIGLGVESCVSGSATTDRLLVDHNTFKGAVVANVQIVSSDVSLTFNEIAGPSAVPTFQGVGVSLNGIDELYPQQPVLIGNYIHDHKGVGVGPSPDTAFSGVSTGGAVLGGAGKFDANLISGNNGAPASEIDTTLGGTIDGTFNTSTPSGKTLQIDSVDAVVSTTAAAIAGVGAPAQ